MKSQDDSLEGLTDEQFADLLARPAGAEAHASQDVEALRTAMASYRTETLQWAERRSATQPSLQPAARRSRVWAAVPQWSLAAVAVISIAAGVAHVYDWPGPDDETVAASQESLSSAPAEKVSAADIAADNRLLLSIDQQLSYHAPVESLGLKPAHRDESAAPGVID